MSNHPISVGATPRRSSLGWHRPALSVAVVALLVLLVGAGPAAAHGGPGLIEVGEPESAGELQVEFPVRITYENDGHPADEVEGLTVSGKGPDGAELAPTEAFVPGDAPGVFLATVTLPAEGQWELTVEAVEPPATTTISVDVAGAVTETTEGDVGPDDTAPDGPDEGEGSAPDGGDDTVGSGAPVDDLDETDDLEAAAADGDDDGGFPVVAVIIAVLVAGAAGVVGFRLATRGKAS